ncbi:DsbA family protein [Mammaliicoccus sciuri]|uniref:DsbA family protein n=1 Tax=Mammaliicoccus sciuri TaxID=1296 RepID=UPI00195D1DB2|nr:thioredoxin domain-containing protein [Mammaliicoccus sciuri]MCD8895058.1 DsbA family protein [Mammaliicoccus sciuri]MCD8913122.1 DsbA family protein [Mammaliicoccus sciuri]MCJ0911772.1 DsbA family protein [Mammaliicoccus sciuri]
MANKNSNSNIMFLMIAILVVVVGIVLLVVFGGSGSDNKEDSLFDRTVKATDLSKDTKDNPTHKKDKAKVQIVEFGDFKCPACKAFETNYMDQIEKDYIDKDKVEYRFVNAPFHGEGSEIGGASAHAVYKIAPDAYWDFHRALFEAQPDDHNAETDDEWLDLKVIQKAVDGLDIDKSKKDQIMKLVKDRNSESYKQMKNDSDLTNKYDVDVTPTIVVDGKVLSDPMDYDKVSKAIDQAIEKKNK